MRVQKKPALSRRTFLQGLGASIGLPLLDAMIPTWAKASPRSRQKDVPTEPKRFMVCYVPNGVILPSWRPNYLGPHAELPRTLSGLEPVKEHLAILGGLSLSSCAARVDDADVGEHARAASSFLTGVRVHQTQDEQQMRAGISVDQFLVARQKNQTKIPYLALGCDPETLIRGSDGVYAKRYCQRISWSSSLTPCQTLIDPQALFARLYGDVEARLSPEESRRRNEDRQSILDQVRESRRSLDQQVSIQDRQLLDHYYTGLRELELRLQAAPTQVDASTEGGALIPHLEPHYYAKHYGEQLEITFGLIRLAFQADLTRVAAFLLADEFSERSFESEGINSRSGFHSLTHRSYNADEIQRINQFHIGKFSKFIQAMKGTPQVEGSLLDRTLTLYGGGLSDGLNHSYDDLPILLVGGRALGLRVGGQHVRFGDTPTGVPLAKLHTSILRITGIEVSGFGDTQGYLKI